MHPYQSRPSRSVNFYMAKAVRNTSMANVKDFLLAKLAKVVPEAHVLAAAHALAQRCEGWLSAAAGLPHDVGVSSRKAAALNGGAAERFFIMAALRPETLSCGGPDLFFSTYCTNFRCNFEGGSCMSPHSSKMRVSEYVGYCCTCLSSWLLQLMQDSMQCIFPLITQYFALAVDMDW